MYMYILTSVHILFIIQLAWAPGRGVKGASFTNCWDQSTGTSLIPWDKVTGQELLNQLAEGGWVEPNTCPPGMKALEPVNGASLLVK